MEPNQRRLMPEVQARQPELQPRQMYVARSLVAEHGRTPGCPRCSTGSGVHSEECRARIASEIQKKEMVASGAAAAAAASAAPGTAATAASGSSHHSAKSGAAATTAPAMRMVVDEREPRAVIDVEMEVRGEETT